MPELPEVETVAAGLRKLFHERTIRQVICNRDNLRYPLDQKILNKKLQDKQIKKILRRGKYMIWEVSSRNFVLVHLGMTGRFRMVPSKTPVAKHEHIQFRLDNSCDIRYEDPRRFGIVLLTPNWKEHPLIANLGPEPIPSLDPQCFLQNIGNRDTAVKKFIMDQQVVVGVGNIYANEALFKTKIHPEKSIRKITPKKWQQLAQAISDTLNESIELGGTTLEDGGFSDVDGNYGEFALNLQVYGRKGEPCHKCGTSIESMVLGGRSTFFCKKCQKK